MNKNRIFAILNWKRNRTENVKNEIVEKLRKRDGDKILLFYKKSDGFPVCFEKEDSSVFQAIPIADEDGVRNRASALNFVYKYLKENFKNSFGYVFYDSIKINSDPVDFFDSIEEMMSKLNLDVWFNTYTDRMNFIFTKFDGRVSVSINEPELMKKYNKKIIWTSHSNPNVSIVNLDLFEIPSDGKTFDDKFENSMFWIIKFLCERARDKKGFMNHYPTIEEEIGIFSVVDFKNEEKQLFTQELMQKENTLFNSFGLDHTPNQDIEALMDFMIDRLKSFS